MPIVDAVYRILYENMNARDAVVGLNDAPCARGARLSESYSSLARQRSDMRLTIALLVSLVAVGCSAASAQPAAAV